MPTKLNPYLSFRDNARQAMEFYHAIFGGRLQMQTFGEAQASEDPADANRIMHSELAADNGILFFGSDIPSKMEHHTGANNISLSLTGEDEAELRGYFEKLSAGGAVSVPLAKSSWGDTFGMFTDKFGVDWLVNISGQRA
jgi:PhnB protein